MILSLYEWSNAMRARNARRLPENWVSRQKQCRRASVYIMQCINKENQAYVTMNSELAVVNSIKVLESSVTAHWNQRVNVQRQPKTSTKHWLPTGRFLRARLKAAFCQCKTLPYPHLEHAAPDYAPQRAALWSEKRCGWEATKMISGT